MVFDLNEKRSDISVKSNRYQAVFFRFLVGYESGMLVVTRPHYGNILEKVGIFADVQNIYYTSQQAFKRNFNYNAFWAEATEFCEIGCAFAYAIDRGNEKQRQFQNILRAIGFEVKLKPFIQRQDGSAKGDWDVGITIDIMENAPSVDRIMLLSGDGDFSILMERIKHLHGTVVDIYGVRSLTANALINSADNFREINSDLLL